MTQSSRRVHAAWVLVFEIGVFFDTRAGARPQLFNTEYLLGMRETASIWLINLVNSIQSTLVFFLILVFLRALVKNRWLAAFLFVLLFAVPKLLGSDHPVIEGAVWVAIYGMAAIAVVRCGLIVLAMGIIIADGLLNVPYTLDFSIWFTPRVLFTVLAFVAMAIWSFYTSLAGRRFWKDEFLD